jgi:HD-GYP domain-containing protein (c-di-GMP phosphodiesterase class II)
MDTLANTPYLSGWALLCDSAGDGGNMPTDDELTQPQRRLSLLESHVGFKLEHVLDHALGVRDNYTREHSQRVVALSEAIGARMGLNAHQMDILSLAAGLHDIGKIGIPDSILLKSGKLSAQEYEGIKAHPMIAANMLRSLVNPMLDEVADCVLHHHEHWDGCGYPDHLAGEEIPLLSRIVAVVDAYDAMTTRRNYRAPVEKADAIELIASLSGTQFCPEAVAAFVEVIADI